MPPPTIHLTKACVVEAQAAFPPTEWVENAVKKFSPSLAAVWGAQSLPYQANQAGPQQQQPDDSPVTGWFNKRYTAHWPIKTQPPGTQQQPCIQGVVVIIVHNLPIKENRRCSTSKLQQRKEHGKKDLLRHCAREIKPLTVWYKVQAEKRAVTAIIMTNYLLEWNPVHAH